MPAKIIHPSDEPDLSFEAGEQDAASIQDCINIINAYERGVHYSATEDSVFAPISHTIQSNKYWAKANVEVLGARLLTSSLIETDTNGLSIRAEGDNTISRLKGKNLEDSLQVLKDDCIPCDGRVKLALESIPTSLDLDFYLDDIKKRIHILGQVDSLLRDTDIFKDICPLLNVLNFMCVPDLQRLVAVLMASLFRVNFNMGDKTSMITGLILPIVMPILSGVVNMIDQFQALILSPIDCILDAILEQLNKLNVFGSTQPISNQVEQARDLVGIGLSEAYKSVVGGKNHLETKLTFYTEALKKAVTDWTGEQSNQLLLGQEKLRTIQLINLVRALIDLKRKGSKMCETTSLPSRDELDNFFATFLNPHSHLQFSVDPDGAIRIEEPGEPLYQIEQPAESVKIISYEPDDLLQKSAGSTFKCSLHTDPKDIDKINKWIRELNEAG